MYKTCCDNRSFYFPFSDRVLTEAFYNRYEQDISGLFTKVNRFITTYLDTNKNVRHAKILADFETVYFPDPFADLADRNASVIHPDYLIIDFRDDTAVFRNYLRSMVVFFCGTSISTIQYFDLTVWAL